MPDKAMVYEGPTPVRTARSPEELANEILEKLTYAVGKDPIVARQYDWMQATILAVRDRVIDRWMESTRTTWQKGDKRVYYFSMEFLIGRLMRDVFSNLEFVEPVREALKTFDVNLDELFEVEPDAALGNGGLGRLAACFMESMSSVQVPAYGYGIRYVHGMFRQEISDGWQVEIPEDWLSARPIPGNSSGARAPTRLASAAMSCRSPIRTARCAMTGSPTSACWPSPTIPRWWAGKPSA